MTMQNGVGALASTIQRKQQQPQGVGNFPRAVGVGAVAYGTPRGLARAAGVGILGPNANDNNANVPNGNYEISGTQVALYADNATPPPRGTNINPSTPGVIGFFNNDYGENGGKVAGTPDQVAVDSTKIMNGRLFAHVTTSTGSGQETFGTNVKPGMTGWTPVDYVAPQGWTASHGGTGPIPQPNQPQPEPSTNGDVTSTTTAKTNYIPWIIGGVALAGLIVGGAVMGKKGYRRVKAHSRLRRIKSRSRLRRAYA